jgi:ankyrin repeat protein
MAKNTPISIEAAVTREAELADWRRKNELVNQPNALADQLVMACQDGNLDKVNALLQAGCDANAIRSFGAALCCAMMSSRAVEVAKLLLAASADPNLRDSEGWTPIFYAAGNNLAEGIRVLAKAGADIDARCFSNGWTPLMNAACFGHEACAAELLRLGADIDVRSSDGVNAIDIASSNGQERMAESLRAWSATKVINS